MTASETIPVAIIGYGTAGVNAAIALRNEGFTGRIVAFSDTEISPYSPILTSYYVAGRKSYEGCFPWSDEALAELEVEIHTNSAIVDIDPQSHQLTNQAGEKFTYEKCLISVGAHPLTNGFPIQCAYRPLVLRSMDDAQRMKDAFARPGCKKVLISGASMIALKCLEAALAQGLETTLVGMNAHILDCSALPVAAKRFERALKAQGVKLRLGQTIAQVRTQSDADPSPLEVEFSSGEVECFDEIVVAHGVRSNLSFIAEGALKIDQALVVDEFMRTSDPDIYAAGDCAQALELISGKPQVLGIWKTAAIQGACAGAVIAAELAGCAPDAKKAYHGAIMTNTIAVNDALFISAGDVFGEQKRRVQVREDDTMTLVCVFEDGPEGERLVGFNLVSDVDEPGGVAYDTAAMLSLRIEEAHRR